MKHRHLAFFALAFVSVAQALPLYRVIDLGDFPGGAEQGQAYALNASGQVVGRGQIASGGRAFLAADDANGASTLIDLGQLPSLPRTSAVSINGRGQIVGSSGDGDKARAFLWNPSASNQSSGTMLEVLGLPGERNHGTATGINDLGQIIGISSGRAFLWTPNVANGTTGTAVDLGGLTSGAASLAFGINSSGRIVGTSATTGADHAFLWTPTIANGNSGSMIDLGSLSGAGASQATAINQAGDVIGTSATATGQHAFLWRPNGQGMLDLGDFADGSDFSYAYGINSARAVVGNGNGNGGDHAFFWTETDGLVDLNSLLDASGASWTLRYAQAINDNGQIAGWGEVDPDGAGPLEVGTHAFRLERVAEIPAGELFVQLQQPNELTLRFVARNGVTYQLEGRANLQAAWQTIGNPVVGEGGLISISQPMAGDHFFYRVLRIL